MKNKDQYKILVVDDEKDIQEFIEYNLKKEGFKVISAGDGLDAVKLAKDKSKTSIFIPKIYMRGVLKLSIKVIIFYS